MSENRQKNFKITLIAVIIAAIAAACVFLYILMNGSKAPVQNTASPSAASSASSAPTASSSSVLATAAITPNSYDVYKLADLDFGFVIADIHVATANAVNIPLSSFTTSEGIQLDEISSYTDALAAQSYTLSSQNIVTSLVGSGSGFDAKILIPFKDKSAASISVVCSLNARNDMSFDLTSANTDGSSLKIKAAPSSSARSFQASIEGAVELDPEDLLKADNTKYSLPSTARVFAVHVSVTAPSGGSVTITSASFVSNEYGTATAEATGVHTADDAGILDRTITDSGDGYVFFLMLDPGHTIREVEGQMILQMADESQNTTADVTFK